MTSGERLRVKTRTDNYRVAPGMGKRDVFALWS